MTRSKARPARARGVTVGVGVPGTGPRGTR
jgi:hypothetical protein